MLDQLPDALVLGLTATPPEALTADQALLVDELFGTPLLPSRSRRWSATGDLAPFAELAWLTTPTASEDEWLAEEAERFRELTTADRPGVRLACRSCLAGRRFAASDGRRG